MMIQDQDAIGCKQNIACIFAILTGFNHSSLFTLASSPFKSLLNVANQRWQLSERSGIPILMFS